MQSPETEATKPGIAIAKGLLRSTAARATLEWLRTQNEPLPFQWYAGFHGRFPDWPVTTRLRRRAEIALVSSGLPGFAKETYFASNPPETNTGKIHWARILLAKGQSKEAIEFIRPLWWGERLMMTTEQQIRKDFSNLLTAKDHRNRMIFLMFRKDWTGALKAAQDAGPGAEQIVKARMAVVQRSKTAKTLLDNLPKPQQMDALALYSQLLLLVRENKYAEAGDIIIRLTNLNALHKSENQLSTYECRDWEGQQRYIIRELLDEKNFDAAYKVASAPVSKIGCIHGDADFLAGWIALRFLGKTDEAQKHFDILAENADSSSMKARAAYWQGRVAEQLGNEDTAKAAYLRSSREWATFYGQLASLKLPGDFLIPQPVTVPADIQKKFDDMTIVQAIRLLGESGADDMTLALYSELASYLPDEYYLEALAALAVEQQNPRAQLTIAKIAQRRGIFMGVRAYPTLGIPYDADNAGKPVESPLLYAIAHQESAFNPRAKSHAGALGLMQLMPDTARMTANRAGVDFDLSRLTLDPAYNAQLGAAHLRDLLDDWNGSLILSFASYNAGGGNVRKWLAAHGDPRSPDVDTIDWIERIPFYETRHYVQRIAENLMIYRMLMGVRKPPIFTLEAHPSIHPAPPERSLP